MRWLKYIGFVLLALLWAQAASAQTYPLSVWGGKVAVNAATTANITLSGEQTVDGVALTAGMYALVKDQSSAEQNGIYTVSAGSWTRRTDADTSFKIAGAQVTVIAGTTNAYTVWTNIFQTTDTIGTTAMVWYLAISRPTPLDTSTTFDGVAFEYLIWFDSFSGVWKKITASNAAADSAFSSLYAKAAPGGRLTLTSATPVMVATVSASTSIYYALYLGDNIALYDGSSWVPTTFTELTNTTTDNTKNPAAVAADSNYDLFVWNDSGTIRLGRGPAWTSSTARGTGAGTTELERVDGIWVNKIAITNGPAAQRGRYVGTVRSNGTSTIDYIFGATAADGTAGSLGVWNMYNRVDVRTMVRMSRDSWTTTTGDGIRAPNGSATMRVSFVYGMDEDAVEGSYNDSFTAGGGGTAAVGVALDATNAFHGSIGFNGLANLLTFRGEHVVNPGIGFHYISAVEQAITATASFYGDIGVAYAQNGLAVRLRM